MQTLWGRSYEEGSDINNHLNKPIDDFRTLNNFLEVKKVQFKHQDQAEAALMGIALSAQNCKSVRTMWKNNDCSNALPTFYMT